jgi:membrane-bound lytic murein transglycosylase A
MLAGTELAWFRTPLDAYIVQVNGSAKLTLPDGKTAFIGYAGATDGEYLGLGDSLVKEGLIKEEDLTLSAVRKMWESDPTRIQDLINRNNRFIFFSTYDGNNWPAGCLGARVTEKSSLATDKSIYPAGGLVMVDTQTAGFDGKKRPVRRFMLDQDAGGAIRAPGRADIFMGIGPSAEILAGGQYSEGTMYYFYLKPEYASQYPLPEKAAASVKTAPASAREAAQSAGSPEAVRMGGLGTAKADGSNPTG